MVKIYYRGSCGSSRCAFAWFKKYDIDIQKEQISKITKEDLKKVLILSERGMQDVVKRSEKSSVEAKEALTHMLNLSFNEALEFTVSHPYILQTPIILEKTDYLVGYNEEEIRKFLPQKFRRYKFYK